VQCGVERVQVREGTEDAGKENACLCLCQPVSNHALASEHFFCAMSADINILLLIGCKYPVCVGTMLPQRPAWEVGQVRRCMRARMMSIRLWNWLSKCGRSRKPEANAIHFLIRSHGPHQVHANLILPAKYASQHLFNALPRMSILTVNTHRSTRNPEEGTHVSNVPLGSLTVHLTCETMTVHHRHHIIQRTQINIRL
jgi:hypothetical protein